MSLPSLVSSFLAQKCLFQSLNFLSEATLAMLSPRFKIGAFSVEAQFLPLLRAHQSKKSPFYNKRLHPSHTFHTKKHKTTQNQQLTLYNSNVTCKQRVSVEKISQLNRSRLQINICSQYEHKRNFPQVMILNMIHKEMKYY
jgi:hypothetical protein